MPRQAPATDAELQAAWQQRRRANWPPTFDAVMADPLLASVVRTTALAARLRQQRLARRAGPQHTGQPPPVAAATAPCAAPAAAPRHRTTFDPKRLAAGDFDEPAD